MSKMTEIKYSLIIKRTVLILIIICLVLYLFWTFSRKLNFRNFDLSGPKGSNSSVVKVKHVFDQLYGTNISKLEHSKLEGLLNRILSKLNDSDGIPKASRQYIDKMKQINSTKPFQGDNISDSILKRMNEYLSALSKDDRITSDRNLTKDIMKYLLILNTTANVKVQETNTTRVSKGKLTSPVLSPTTKRHERLAHTLSTSTDTISTAVQPFCDTNKLLSKYTASLSYRKKHKISDTRKFAVNTLKVEQDGFSLQ